MEININCDLGEKSKHHSNHNDPKLLDIVNSANVACGYHAGDDQSMNQVVEISKKNQVSIGAHPSFNDPENFGRERMNLPSSEIKKLIFDQYDILQKISVQHERNVVLFKPSKEFKEIINLLYDGVKLFIPWIFFSLIALKYFITSELIFLLTSIPKSQYRAASPRFDIFFIMPCYTSTFKTMEININCDLGEKSKHHSNKYDPDLLEIVNSANIACGYHAGDKETMDQVIKISKKKWCKYWGTSFF